MVNIAQEIRFLLQQVATNLACEIVERDLPKFLERMHRAEESQRVARTRNPRPLRLGLPYVAPIRARARSSLRP